MIRAIIFDFDGLILDTEVPEFQAWQEIYRAHGCELPLATWVTAIGTSSDVFDPCAYLETQVGRAVDREAIRLRRRQRCAELLRAQPILPGVHSYLVGGKRLGLHLGVASSSSRAWVLGHLTALQLSAFFECIKCSDDVPRVKPDPALYQAALTALGLQADQAIALEDSPHGVAAAKRAGLYCVAVPNPLTRELSFAQADLQLNSLADLPLERLLATVQRNGLSPDR